MNDLINRQAAINELWKALYEYEDETEKKFMESDELDIGDWYDHRIFAQNMSDIDRQVILNLPSALPWIPCSEGLPTIETDVLVTAHNGTTQYVAWMDAFEKWHSDEEEVIEGYEPLAWMPLPVPYKGDKDADSD